jgi:hypothetical protein
MVSEIIQIESCIFTYEPGDKISLLKSDDETEEEYRKRTGLNSLKGNPPILEDTRFNNGKY